MKGKCFSFLWGPYGGNKNKTAHLGGGGNGFPMGHTNLTRVASKSPIPYPESPYTANESQTTGATRTTMKTGGRERSEDDESSRSGSDRFSDTESRTSASEAETTTTVAKAAVKVCPLSLSLSLSPSLSNCEVRYTG